MGSALSVKNYESPADRRLAGGFLADTSYGFPAPDLSDQSPMLFVDLLTRPRHQGEALREPRLRHHLRISIILLPHQHVFHS